MPTDHGHGTLAQDSVRRSEACVPATRTSDRCIVTGIAAAVIRSPVRSSTICWAAHSNSSSSLG
jgi:hypothetical protein